MKGVILIVQLFVSQISVFGQTNKMGARWILGSGRGIEAVFTDTTRPVIQVKYDAPPPYYYTAGHSNICDSATGKLLFSCNGMVLYDSTGDVMENGDSLVENKIYTDNGYPVAPYTQASIILPKNGHEYYVFLSTISDSAYNYYITNPDGSGQFPYDRLQYNIVDMNENGGLGKVIIKGKRILQGVAIHKTMMMACRHSNGVDWWLLKQGEYDTNRIYRFLVKADTVKGPYIQNFPEPKFPFYDITGQYAFSRDGTKFAAIQGRGKMNKLFIADFDRCTGELLNPVIKNIPIDSTTKPSLDNVGNLDSVNTGVCFSPNGQFVYISKRWNIYQYEYLQSDSILAWYRVQHGPDTTFLYFEYYGHLYLGLDNRICIGKISGGTKQLSVIDKPDIKGVGCQFCRKCFRLDTVAIFGMTSPPNMPDYTLGASGLPCWPVGNQIENKKENEELIVFPNPGSSIFYIKNAQGKKKDFFTITGQLLLTTNKDEIEVKNFAKGMYYLRCEGRSVKVVVE